MPDHHQLCHYIYLHFPQIQLHHYLRALEPVLVYRYLTMLLLHHHLHLLNLYLLVQAQLSGHHKYYMLRILDHQNRHHRIHLHREPRGTEQAHRPVTPQAGDRRDGPALVAAPRVRGARDAEELS